MPVTALRPATEPPQRSPERQSLAAAIDRLRSAEDYLVSVRAAADIQLDREFAAGHAVDAAQAALVEAKGGSNRWLVSALLAVDGSESPVAAAERVLAAAVADRDEQHHRRELLREEEIASDAEVRRARDAVRGRADNVFDSDRAVAQRRQQLEDAQAELFLRVDRMRRDFELMQKALAVDADAALAAE